MGQLILSVLILKHESDFSKLYIPMDIIFNELFDSYDYKVSVIINIPGKEKTKVRFIKFTYVERC